MNTFVLVGIMGGLGSVARYAISSAVQRSTSSGFPLGTLSVNLIGCLLVGIIAAFFAGRLPMREEYRSALIPGFLGGFTTFSAFGLETFELLRAGRTGMALLNVGVSIVAGIIGVWLGYRVGTMLA